MPSRTTAARARTRYRRRDEWELGSQGNSGRGCQDSQTEHGRRMHAPGRTRRTRKKCHPPPPLTLPVHPEGQGHNRRAAMHLQAANGLHPPLLRHAAVRGYLSQPRSFCRATTILAHLPPLDSLVFSVLKVAPTDPCLSLPRLREYETAAISRAFQAGVSHEIDCGAACLGAVLPSIPRLGATPLLHRVTIDLTFISPIPLFFLSVPPPQHNASAKSDRMPPRRPTSTTTTRRRTTTVPSVSAPSKTRYGVAASFVTPPPLF